MTDKEINAYLSSQSTNEMDTILEVDAEVYNDTLDTENFIPENSIIEFGDQKICAFDNENTLINYNLQDSNFKVDTIVTEVESELVIEVPEGSNYIGEFMNDLPNNVMLNKVTTGSGMTTLALTNDVKYVIAVPYVNLLLNKQVWCTNHSIDALFVHAKGHREEDIYSYTGNKIMTTYDSLHKVTNILKENRDISEWKLFVDESHTLLQIAGFRHKAVESVLNNYTEYGKYVFGTATPVLDKYKLTEIKGIKKCKLQWSNLEKVNLDIRYASKNISLAMVSILKDYHSNKIEGNAHVFVNSPQMIVQIFKGLKRFGVKTNEIRVVCSNSDYNTKLLAKEGLAISTVDDKLRGISFYTSTAFEGCDIYDKNGKTYVVVDADRTHTAIDIYTTLPQIMGRIRDTKYKNQCTLIVDPSNKFKLSPEEYSKEVAKNIATGKDMVEIYNNATIEVKRAYLKDSHRNSNFIVLDTSTDTLHSNENALASEMNSYEAMSNEFFINRDGVREPSGEYVSNSIVTKYIESDVVIDKSIFNRADAREGKRFSTKELLIACCKEFQEASNDLEAQKVVKAYAEDNAFVGEAMRLGADRLKALGYKKGKIQAELNFTDPRTKNSRELKLLNTLKLKAGQWYSSKYIKAKMKEIYTQQGVKATPNLKHLDSIYGIEIKVRVIKGVRTRGILIKVIKLKVNNN